MDCFRFIIAGGENWEERRDLWDFSLYRTWNAILLAAVEEKFADLVEKAFYTRCIYDGIMKWTTMGWPSRLIEHLKGFKKKFLGILGF